MYLRNRHYLYRKKTFFTSWTDVLYIVKRRSLHHEQTFFISWTDVLYIANRRSLYHEQTFFMSWIDILYIMNRHCSCAVFIRKEEKKTTLSNVVHKSQHIHNLCHERDHHITKSDACVQNKVKFVYKRMWILCTKKCESCVLKNVNLVYKNCCRNSLQPFCTSCTKHPC
jgi:hypothetical protein